MDLWSFDKNLEQIHVTDVFIQLLWHENFIGGGDFELCVPAYSTILSNYPIGGYVGFWDDVRGHTEYMLIESVKVETDVETGDYVVVAGRSLEHLLDRRIVWGLEDFTGQGLLYSVEKLVLDSIVSPQNTNRRIPEFRLNRNLYSPTYNNWPSEAVYHQYTGDSVYKAVNEMCTDTGTGWFVKRMGAGYFDMYLRKPVDRSYRQSSNVYVTFSEDYGNLQSSEFTDDIKPYMNTVLLGGRGEGAVRFYAYQWETSVEPKGLDRREMFYNASDVKDKDGETQLTDQQYRERLWKRGTEVLIRNRREYTFSSKLLPDNDFRFNVHYFLGDYVNVENRYGVSSICQVTGLTRSFTPDEQVVYPTFAHIQEA